MKALATTGITLLTVGLLLGGCATPYDQTADAPLPPQPAPTVVAYEVGTIVEADTELAQGQTAYPLPDGTHVVVSRTEPLPEAVQADLNAKAAATMEGQNDGTSDLVMGAAGKAHADSIRATGKRIILGLKIYGYATSMQEHKADFWTFMGGPGYEPYYSDRASAEAAVNAWLETAEDSAIHAVVWTG